MIGTSYNRLVQERILLLRRRITEAELSGNCASVKHAGGNHRSSLAGKRRRKKINVQVGCRNAEGKKGCRKEGRSPYGGEETNQDRSQHPTVQREGGGGERRKGKVEPRQKEHAPWWGIFPRRRKVERLKSQLVNGTPTKYMSDSGGTPSGSKGQGLKMWESVFLPLCRESVEFKGKAGALKNWVEIGRRNKVICLTNAGKGVTNSSQGISSSRAAPNDAEKRVQTKTQVRKGTIKRGKRRKNLTSHTGEKRGEGNRRTIGIGDRKRRRLILARKKIKNSRR